MIAKGQSTFNPFTVQYEAETVAEEEEAKQAITRAADHAKLMGMFEADFAQMRCPNMLLEAWLIWAKSCQYAGPRDLAANTVHSHAIRATSVTLVSWAVPSHAALEKIMQWSVLGSGGDIEAAGSGRSRVVEVGSGTGYWASLLRQYGADIVAVDSANDLALPVEQREKHIGRHFPSTLRQDGRAYLDSQGGCPDRALLLCWPRDFADEVLDAYKGPVVIWVGELGIQSREGATWTLAHSKHADDWEEVDSLKLPTWALVFDLMVVYRRKAAAPGQ